MNFQRVILFILFLTFVSAETIKLANLPISSSSKYIDLSNLNTLQDIFKHIQLPTQGNSVSGGDNFVAGSGNLLKGDYNQLIGNQNALFGLANGVKGSHNAVAGNQNVLVG